MKKLKLAAALAILLALGGVKAKAQTGTTIVKYFPNAGISIQLPPGCLSTNGEYIDVYGPIRWMWHYTGSINPGDTRSGFVTYSGVFKGKGRITGKAYTAVGTFEEPFLNQDSFGDGQFTITQSFRIWVAGVASSMAFRHQEGFTILNQGNTEILNPPIGPGTPEWFAATTVCK